MARLKRFTAIVCLFTICASQASPAALDATACQTLSFRPARELEAGSEPVSLVDRKSVV